MIEGMDLAGKGIILSAIKEFLVKGENVVFDAPEFERRNGRMPTKDDIVTYDAVLSAEPTFALVGKAIREDIVKDNGIDYGAKTTAMAYALDRDMLYQNLILPALELKKTVVQERGLPSSLVYQPIQEDGMDMQDILEMPGNKIAMKNPPDVLIVLTADPAAVISRIEGREKKDKAIFENLEFQAQIKKRYESLWFKNIFEKLGTKIHFIDTTSIKPEDTVARALEIIKQVLYQ